MGPNWTECIYFAGSLCLRKIGTLVVSYNIKFEVIEPVQTHIIQG